MSARPGQVGTAPAPRRLIVSVIWDKRGDVEDYAVHAIAGLGPHAAHTLVVVNGELTAPARERLDGVADEILVRENRGFDIWGHKHALDHLGDRIDDFDEVILTNDTWYGPVRPYGPVLSRMETSSADFWGMTDHAREEPNPFTGQGVLHYHLQSFWIVVRRRMFLSQAWRAYWRDLPAMPSYFDAVLQHEAVFTQHFADAGFTHDVAFPSADYPTNHPALFNPDLLLADGCPILKRRVFFHYPPFLDRHGVIGRELLHDVEGYGFPLRLIWKDIARNVPPRVANANTAALEVLPDHSVTGGAAGTTQVAVLVHVEDLEAFERVLPYAANLSASVDLIITTSSEAIFTQLQGRTDHDSRPDVRLLPAEGANPMSALLIGCRDLLLDSSYELIVRLIAQHPRSSEFTSDRYRQRYQLDNLLNSPGYAANLIELFEHEPGLGAVFPPTTTVGRSPLGAGWGELRSQAVALSERLDIRVPFDEVSPLAPYGGMMVFRPEALRLMAEYPWKYSDYAPSARSGDSSLDQTQERLIAYAMGELGYHCRTVLTREHADISHPALEFVLDQMSSTTPGYPVEQIQFLHRAGRAGRGSGMDLAMMYVRLNHPQVVSALSPRLRRAAKRLTSLIRRGRGV